MGHDKNHINIFNWSFDFDINLLAITLNYIIMSTTKLIIAGRLDEVPTIGQFTIDAYLRDKTDFATYKPARYTAGFLTDLQAKADAVNGIVNPVVLTGELKVITLKLTNLVLGLRETMNLLEGYVEDAEGLTVAVKDFGISGVRKKINSGDVEGLNLALGTLLTNIGNNIIALTDKGYTAAAQTALKNTKKDIFDNNASQNKKEGERAALVQANKDLINDFLKDVKAIWKDGKRLYKINAKVKLKDYTNTLIIKRIRNDELHTLIVGKVLNKLNKIEGGAKLVARPILIGKRGKTVKSDAKGMFELKGLKPTTYMITVTLANGESFAMNVEAVTNTTVTQDLVQPV